MSFLIFVYVAEVLITGVAAMFRVSFSFGLAGTLAPLIALIAGGGVTSNQSRVGTIFIALLMLTAALYWIQLSGWQLHFFGNQISGFYECIIGFIVGLIFGLGDRPRFRHENIKIEDPDE
ncbi:MAG: hypothetical protein KGQ42_08695 [Alphaproteobacteria bacterium]|nr:hypothetical protein [Alphaproteobacteria bacterium]MDE2042994.1 hypothetical protein [Alphaproteobacteria bacterium]MDE2340112.1 hypothetical protein [Alphaproteobacteria bacterium]